MELLADLAPSRSPSDPIVLAAAAHVPTAIATPVQRWRKLVELVHPHEDARVGTMAFRATAHALATCAGRDGRGARPTIEQLRQRVGGRRPGEPASERTIQYALAALERRGLIYRQQRGRARASEITLLLPRSLAVDVGTSSAERPAEWWQPQRRSAGRLPARSSPRAAVGVG